MAFSLDGRVGASHVHTHAYGCRVLWFRDADNRRNPWCRACDRFDHVLLELCFEFLLQSFSCVERYAPVSLRDGFHGWVDVEFHLMVLQLADAFCDLVGLQQVVNQDCVGRRAVDFLYNLHEPKILRLVEAEQ